MKFKVERICRTDSMSAIPRDRLRIDLAASAERLREEGMPVEPFELYMVARLEGLEATVYPSGRVLFHPLNDKARAKELAEKLIALMVMKG